MQIVKYIDLFVSSIINIYLYFFAVKKIFNIKYTKNRKTFIASLLFASIFVGIINTFNKDLFKILLTFPFVVIAIKNVFSTNFKKSIIYFVISTLYLFVGELITAIVFSLLPFDYTFIVNNILGRIIGVLVVTVFTLPLLYINKLNSAVNRIEKSINEKSKIIITILLILAIGAIAYRNSTGTINVYNIIVNIVVTIVFIIMIYLYYSENVELNELSENYNVMFRYLENYEKELTEKRKIIHDYKNQLIVINGYIGNDKKLKEYLNEIITEQKSISESSVIKNIDKLPRGLKGLIYYKLSHFDSNIKIDLNVKNSLKKFEELPSKLNKDILKIVGILLDNAIEAVSNEKEKFIFLSFSIVKNKFIMDMRNTCTKSIKMDNIMDIGFSTKGKNRGYGLALVQDILNREKKIMLDFSIDSDEFISKMQIKL